MPRPGIAILTRYRLLGAALALLAGGVLAPGEARAGCAHDAPARPSAEGHFRLLRDCGAMGLTADVADRVPPSAGDRERPGTCSGPSCSRRSGLPPAPTSLGVARVGHWALVEVMPPADIPDATSRLADEADARPIRIAEAIFHPPRRGAVAA